MLDLTMKINFVDTCVSKSIKICGLSSIQHSDLPVFDTTLKQIHFASCSGEYTTRQTLPTSKQHLKSDLLSDQIDLTVTSILRHVFIGRIKINELAKKWFTLYSYKPQTVIVITCSLLQVPSWNVYSIVDIRYSADSFRYIVISDFISWNKICCYNCKHRLISRRS